MSKILDQFNKAQLNTKIPAVNPGDTVRVFQKTQATAETGEKKGKDEKAKHAPKTQVFEGLVIAKKHGRGISSNITVRKVLQGVGVEKIFPVNSPSVEKIEIVKRGKVRRSKLYYLRTAKGKRAKLAKREDFKQAIAEIAPETAVEPAEAKPVENAEKK